MSEEIEYLYELPTGWIVIPFDGIFSTLSLNGIKIKQSQYLKHGDFAVIDQGQSTIGGFYNDESLLVPGEPPYIVFGDHTRLIKYVNQRFIAGADGVRVIKPVACINSKLSYYFLHAIKIPNRGYARHFQFLCNAQIPLPPLPEQSRIVAKIEELFSSLDKGIESLKAAQAQLKVYRQAVLKQAFEGKLTNKNVKDGELPEGWALKSLDDLCEKITDGEHFRPVTTSDGIPFLSAKDVRDDGVSFDDPLFISQSTAEKALLRCNPNRNDILIVSRGATIGRMCVVNTENIFCLLGSVILLKIGKLTNPRLVLCFLKSPDIIRRISSISGATAQQAIYLRDLRKVILPIPQSRKEQDEIVAFIESRLSLCDKLEETLAQSLQQAESLRQSILKKAFEGKLVPQDPNDEPASVLLERIRAEREAGVAMAGTKATRRPAKCGRKPQSVTAEGEAPKKRGRPRKETKA